MVKFKFENSSIQEKIINEYAGEIKKIHETLHEKANDEGEFLGWLELPTNYDKKEFERIKKAAKKIQKDSDVLVVIGIGGSYLGARAVIDSLTHSFYNGMPEEKRKNPQILYAGNNLSPVYMNDLLDFISDKDISINVISKSGTTTEPAVTFRIFRELLEKKYGEEGARERIFVTTDRARGKLKEFSTEKGYETFVVPDDIGGRYSVLTAVGLLPIAVAGIDIDRMMKGAADAREKYLDTSIEKNDCLRYAAIRNIMYNKGKSIEILAAYEPAVQMFCEWWKQLYGESEGKDGKGIFPAAVDFSTDLHSMGQWIQDGERTIFETVISVDTPEHETVVPTDSDNLDGLNYMAGRRVDEVNKMAELGTRIAHVDGGVPNLRITIPALKERWLGQLIYFFEKACGISGYMIDVNPFNQPGVEAYKRNMFALLAKPGYEKETEAIKARL